MPEQLIQVVQLPVIEERLRELKSEVDRRVSDALALVCTEETVQAVKDARARLNKQYAELENQRKAVKDAVMGPYLEFEAVYRECVGDPFQAADRQLKAKIADVEGEIKGRCEAELREYFAELCAANHVEWLTFERMGLRIGLTEARQKTQKKLREGIARFVANVAHDVERISDMEDAEKILAEYKAKLDAMDAINAVRERQSREGAEREQMRERAAALEREAQAVAKVEEVAPPEVLAPPVEAEKVYKCAFTVRATKAQLKKLKEFLNQEGIQYE